LSARSLQSQVIRLENGFTTTMREKTEFELQQEANLKAMAKEMGESLMFVCLFTSEVLDIWYNVYSHVFVFALQSAL
jgi:hypothetical protein